MHYTICQYIDIHKAISQTVEALYNITNSYIRWYLKISDQLIYFQTNQKY